MIITKNRLDEKVPKEMIPTRLDSALNLYTNINYENNSGILVYNINPTTWNCLYSFYEMNHKFTMDYYQFKKEDLTYRELIEEFEQVYKKVYEEEQGKIKNTRKQILIDEYKKTFHLKDVQIGDELLPTYELKYSKSKNVWTLYYFENYVASKIESFGDLWNQKVYEQKICPLDSTIKEIEEVELASNIPYLFSLPSNIEKLKQNLITKN